MAEETRSKDEHNNGGDNSAELKRKVDEAMNDIRNKFVAGVDFSVEVAAKMLQSKLREYEAS